MNTVRQHILLAGATGLIGKKLVNLLTPKYEVIIISRSNTSPNKLLSNRVKTITWENNDDILSAVNQSIAVINLAGAPLVGKRWTEKYKQTLSESRIKTTRKIVDSIIQSSTKPKVLINGSAVGIYGMNGKDNAYTEKDAPASDFLASLCAQWEKEALRLEKSETRVVCIRSGIVLDNNDGAFPKIISPYKYYVGGPIGNGNQYFPWIHIVDEVGIILHALYNDSLSGPLNAVAPEIVTSNQLSNAIGKKMQKPNFIPVPSIALKLLYGEASQVLTTGVKVSSQKIISSGYSFKFPTIKEALDDLL